MKVSRKRVEKGLWWDRAWTLIEGCTPVSPGCTNCWSARQTYMRSHQKNLQIRARYSGLTMISESKTPAFNGTIRLMTEELKIPGYCKKPRTWAVWNDLFHPDVPLAFLHRAFEQMYLCQQHTFIICTKRPEHILNAMYEVWTILKTKHPEAKLPLKNVVYMVSMENQECVNNRMPFLLAAKNLFAVLAVSIEPILGPVDLEVIYSGLFGRVPFFDKRKTAWLAREFPPASMTGIPQRRPADAPLIDWIVAGPETGVGARSFNPVWIEDIYKQSRR